MQQRGTVHQVEVRIKNTGDTETSPRTFWVGLSFAHESSSGDSWPIGWQDMMPIESKILSAGEEQTITFNITISETWRAGQYYAVSAIWDSFNEETFLMENRFYSTLENSAWNNFNNLGKTTFYLNDYTITDNSTPFDSQLDYILGYFNELPNDKYLLGKKPLLVFSASYPFRLYSYGEVTATISAGGAMFIDLADILKVTPEGKDGWTTVWLAQELSGGLEIEGLPETTGMFDFGIIWHEFDPNGTGLADYKKDVFTLGKLTVPGIVFSAARLKDDKWSGPKLEFGGTLKFGITTAKGSVISHSFEIKTELLLKSMKFQSLMPNAPFLYPKEYVDYFFRNLEILSGNSEDYRDMTLDDGALKVVFNEIITSNFKSNYIDAGNYYYVDVPAGCENISFASYSGTGQILFIVNKGQRADAEHFVDYFYQNSNEDKRSIVISNPTEGRYYFSVLNRGVDGFDNYNITVEKNNLTANEPILSNVSFSPQVGDESTTFNFYVDYYDADGDAPAQNGAECCISGNSCETMQLISGTPSNGTYKFSTNLSEGDYQFKYIFTNAATEKIETEYFTGPAVESSNDLLNQDSLALVALYRTCNGINWDNKTNWLENNLNTWYGVTVENGRVTVLDLGTKSTVDGNITTTTYDVGNNLTGTIPDEIWNLTGLKHLDLSGNEINGSISPKIGNFKNLTFLRIFQTNFSGIIPSEIGEAVSLEGLYLNGKNFTGEIPSTIGNLKELKYWQIHDTKISGEIPQEIEYLTKLEMLFFPKNNLSGEIPNAVWNLTNLSSIVLSENNLSGELPSAIGKLKGLEQFSISTNDFSGEIPKEIGTLNKLRKLGLSSNSFSGGIPEELGNLVNIGHLYLAANYLSGNVPNTFSNLINLEYLTLYSNELSGNIPNLKNAGDLWFLNVQYNNFTFQNIANSGYTPEDISLYYNPQRQLPAPSKNLSGQDLELEVIEKHPQSTFKWFKDDIEIAGSNQNPFVVPQDNGLYYCKITNPLFPDLTLTTGTVKASLNNSPPNQPQLITPFNNSTVSDPFTISWSCTDPDEGDQLSYKIRIRKDNGDWDGDNDFSQDTSLEVNGLSTNDYGIYDWYIIATDGEFETQSDIWTFTIAAEGDNHPPVFGNNPSPADNSAIGLGDCRLSWECNDFDGDQLTFDLYARQKGYNWDDGATGLTEPYFDAYLDNSGDIIEWKVIASDGKVEVESPIWTFTVQENTSGINLNDSLALVAIYNSCDGDNWDNNTNWLKTPLKDWYGISIENNRVTSINLQGSFSDLFGLKNDLPSEIGLLSNLENLNLSFNEITGSIPPEIGNLVNLKTLVLTHNQLSGSIPPEIGNLNSLTNLVLADNNLSGNIPSEIGELQNLLSLHLRYNQLTGAIPQEIGNLNNLDNLHIYNNNLSGEIPGSIGNLTNLTYLGVSSNNLSGSIPSQLFGLDKLRSLIIAHNNFNGTFPEEISKLSSLQMLRIDGNNFSGQLTDNILQLPNLADIWIENNEFTGIPDFSSKEDLIRLRAYNNRLTFEDIEPNMPVVDIVNNSTNQSAEFVYSPQQKIGEPISEQIEEGQEYKLSIDCGGTYNLYQWFKDGIVLNQPTNASEYIISSFSNEDEGSYMCKVTNSVVPDLVLESYTVTLSAKDITSPTLSVNPSTGSNLSNQFSITLMFSENVSNVAEGISVNNGTASVEGEGKTYTVTINADDNTEVTLFISNTITDMAGNQYEGLSCNYSVGDNTPPRIISFSPSNIQIEDNHPLFIFSFDEEISLGSGNLNVYQNDISTPIIISIPFAESMVNGRDVTVSYNSDNYGNLELNTEYCVSIDSGSFFDLSGNTFEGILNNETWCFTTGNDYATGINEIPKNQLSLVVIPNPSDGRFRLRFENGKTGKYQVQIINELGQIQFEKEIYLSGDVHEEEFDLSHLSSGNYFVKVFDGRNSKTEKIVLK